MAVIRTLLVKLAADVQNFTSGFNTAAARAKKFEGEMATVGGRLKGLFGEASGLGMFAKGLVGAGAVAGIGLLARTIERAADAAGPLVDQFKKGEMSASALTFELATQLPLLRDIRSAAASVYKIFDDTERKAAELGASYERLNATDERRKAILAEIKVLEAPKALRPMVQFQLDRGRAFREFEEARGRASSAVEQRAFEQLGPALTRLWDLKALEIENPLTTAFEKVRERVKSLWGDFTGGLKRGFQAARREAESYRRELRGIADSVAHAVATPMEQFQRSLYDARRAFMRGFLTQEQLDAFTRQLKADLFPAVEVDAERSLSPAGAFRQISLQRAHIPGMVESTRIGGSRVQRVEDEDLLAEIKRLRADLTSAFRGGLTARA